jgi:hypothetical protein
MTPAPNSPVNSGHVSSSLATPPEKLVQHPRVTAPVPVAQHAKPPRWCSCPAHDTLDSARQGICRLAAAVILCSGVQGHGRQNASLLATSRSPRRSKNLKADSHFKLGRNGEEEGLTNTVLRSTGAFEVQTNHTRGAALTGNGDRGTACRLRLRRRTPNCSAIGNTRRLIAWCAGRRACHAPTTDRRLHA